MPSLEILKTDPATVMIDCIICCPNGNWHPLGAVWLGSAIPLIRGCWRRARL